MGIHTNQEQQIRQINHIGPSRGQKGHSISKFQSLSKPGDCVAQQKQTNLAQRPKT